MSIDSILSDSLITNHPGSAARVLERYEPSVAARLLENIPSATVANVLCESLPYVGAEYVAHFRPEKASRVLEKVDGERAVKILRHVRPAALKAITRSLPSTVRSALQRALAYGEETVGGHMNPLAMAVPEDITVADAMRRVRQREDDRAFYPYVVDRNQKLVGVLTVASLMAASSRQCLSDIMTRDVVRLEATATGHDIARIPGRRAYQSIPVIDNKGIFVGVLRHEAADELERRASRVVRPDMAKGIMAIGELYARSLVTALPLLTHVLALSLAGGNMERGSRER